MHKRIAGLPAWAWGIAIVGGLMLGLYLRRRGSTVDTGGAVLPSVVPAGLADLANGASGGGLSAAPPAIDPNLLNALLGSQSSLIASEQTLGALADSAVADALGLAGRVTDNSFALAGRSEDNAFGLATAVIAAGGIPYNLPSSPHGGSPTSPVAAAPIPAAPQPPNTYNVQTGVYVTPESQVLAPTVGYSSSPGGVEGPAIFVFK